MQGGALAFWGTPRELRATCRRGSPIPKADPEPVGFPRSAWQHLLSHVYAWSGLCRFYLWARSTIKGCALQPARVILLFPFLHGILYHTEVYAQMRKLFVERWKSCPATSSSGNAGIDNSFLNSSFILILMSFLPAPRTTAGLEEAPWSPQPLYVYHKCLEELDAAQLLCCLISLA